MTSSSLIGQSGTVSFEPRARLMKLIGGELVSDEVVAVTELVKNAYDADARTVRLQFINVLDDDGEIVITDDGHGMSLDDVATYWMQPGGTTKRGSRRATSRRGRRVLGEKGIGRFAVDKLGSSLTLTTRKKGQKEEVLCSFDWSAFEQDNRMLSDVGCVWEINGSRTVARQGTSLRISGLRARWSERLFRKLSLRLGRLITPFQEADDFRVIIESTDFPSYDGEVSVDYLDQAPHRLDAGFDGDQTVTLVHSNGTSEPLIWNGEGYLDCGPVRIRLYGFDLETPAIARLGPPREVRGWLREWTGVSIYRDGFRLSPYGEPNDDWLRLDQRRVNNPVVRLSNNQVIGFVEISRDENPELQDQTNREGMISNKGFEDLRRLVLFVMTQLEARRQHSRRSDRDVEGTSRAGSQAGDSVADSLEKLAASGGAVKSVRLTALAKHARDVADREQRRVRALTDLYAELAAVGHAAEETSRRVSIAVDALERDLKKLPGEAAKAVRGLHRHVQGLRAELQLLAPVQSSDGARRRTVDLRKELERAGTYFEERLREKAIKLELPEESMGLVRVEIHPENLQRVLMILFNNSIRWLHRTKRPRIRLSIDPNATPRQCALLFSDNGPGIPESIALRAFEPAESGMERARGMGLTLARDIVEGGGGSIEIVQDGRRKGATLRLLLPRKRTRAVRSR